MTLEEPNDIEQYLNNQNETNERFYMPQVIGILPLRNAVVFPGTVMPLAIGRERSKSLLKEIKVHKSVIGIVTQHDPKIDRPNFEEVYNIGTAATVLKMVKLPQESMHIVVHGITRFKIVEALTTKPHLKARIEPIETAVKITKKLKALMVNVKQDAYRVINLSPNVPEEAALLLENIENPSDLADFLAANLSMGTTKKQKLLEEPNAAKRLEKISKELVKQLEVLELSHKIQGKVRESIEKNQREYFLQEQLKAIRHELGEEDRQTAELKEIKYNIKKAKMPKTVEVEAIRELDRLSKVSPASPEYSVIRTYLDWVCELPWAVQTNDQLEVQKAERILNRDHYNLKKVKKRILEFLAVRKLHPSGKSPILCFI